MNDDLEIKELDFSVFHPLDHSIFSKRCENLPGGRLNHLCLWYEFCVLDNIGSWKCKYFDLHSYTEHYLATRDSVIKEWISCIYCDRRK